MKIFAREELQKILSEAKRGGKKIGFTSGVFDLLHRGHVEYLEKSKALCDILVVGVNADSSVTLNKGPFRPIVGEQSRVAVVAALASVDYVFIFPERNNAENITFLKPDLYIKAGDYQHDQLTSGEIVRSYGGEVVLVEMTGGFSTSDIVGRIQAQLITETPLVVPHEKCPAVFLDRDGTIIELVDYLHDPEKVKIFPAALEALKMFSDKGYRIIMVTNQPGIGFGYFSVEKFFAVNTAIFRATSKEKILFDKVYFCPHSSADRCQCRKPNPYFAKLAVEQLNIDLKKSVMIGDMTSDIEFGKRAGCRTVLVGTGKGGKDGIVDVQADFQAKDLKEAANWALNT